MAEAEAGAVSGSAQHRPVPSIPVDCGKGPTVLLVHGQPGRGADWREVASRLSHSRRVVAPDRPGWGANPRPATSLAGNARALGQALECSGADVPATVVGHSLGGGIAIELALQRPDLVAALVLLSSVGVSSAVSGLDRLIALPLLGEGLVRAGAASLRVGAGIVQSVAGRRTSKRARSLRLALFPALSAVMEAGLGEPLAGRARASFLVEQRALVEETPSLEHRLSGLGLPTAVVSGGSDHIVPEASGRLLSERIPGAEHVVLAGAGHSIISERPGEIAAIVLRYSALAVG